MAIEKKLEGVLNAAKIRFECERSQEDPEVIIVKITANGKPFLAVGTSDEGAEKIIEEYK